MRVNNRYIRPKYGLGIFSTFTPVIPNTERSMVKSSNQKKALNRAILIGKPGGEKVAKKSVSKNTSGVGTKRKTVPKKNILIKKQTSNAKKPRKSTTKAKRSKIDWGDGTLNNLIENS